MNIKRKKKKKIVENLFRRRATEKHLNKILCKINPERSKKKKRNRIIINIVMKLLYFNKYVDISTFIFDKTQRWFYNVNVLLEYLHDLNG